MSQLALPPPEAAELRARPRMPLTPLVARRLLRFDLDRLLDASGVRHATVADWLGVSRPAVSAAVACTTLFSQPALEVLLGRLKRPEWFPRLSGLLSTARHASPGAAAAPAPEQRDIELLLGLEAFAQAITVFDPWLVPPHLRVQTYAAALSRLDNTGENRAREQRQAPLTSEVDPLELWWITSEHALHRSVGGTSVMADQRAFLAEMAARPNVTILVIPARIDLPPTTPFQLVHGTPPVVVETSRMAVHHAHDSGSVRHFVGLAEELTQRALPRSDSLRLIQEVRA